MSYAPLVHGLCRATGLPPPESEYRFAPPRMWRFDFAFVAAKVALEVQGGLFVAGRHSRGAALLKEHSKLNAAAARGWRVLFCTPGTLSDVWPEVQQAVSAVRRSADHPGLSTRVKD